jgi:hypothetical protein
MTQDYGEFRPSKLWRRLPAERRLEAAELFWMDEQSADQHVEAVASIAAHMKFRTKSVLGLSVQKRSKYLATLPTISDSIAARALVNYHLAAQRPMMSAFLNSLAIAHEDGLITEENVPRPESDRLRAAATELASKFPAEAVSLYFATLVSQDPETWGVLADVPEIRATSSLPS